MRAHGTPPFREFGKDMRAHPISPLLPGPGHDDWCRGSGCAGKPHNAGAARCATQSAHEGRRKRPSALFIVQAESTDAALRSVRAAGAEVEQQARCHSRGVGLSSRPHSSNRFAPRRAFACSTDRKLKTGGLTLAAQERHEQHQLDARQVGRRQRDRSGARAGDRRCDDDQAHQQHHRADRVRHSARPPR